MKLALCILLGLQLHAAFGYGDDVVINEIMRNPTFADDDCGEWFELYNGRSTTVNLNRWTFCDNSGESFRVKSNLLIPPGGFVVLGNGNNTNLNGGLVVNYVYSSRRMTFRSRDSLIMLSSNGRRVDRVNWSRGGFPSLAGSAMALKNATLPNNQGHNWCLSTTPYGQGDLGTPGRHNDCFGTPVAPPVKAPAATAPAAPVPVIVTPSVPVPVAPVPVAPVPVAPVPVAPVPVAPVPVAPVPVAPVPVAPVPVAPVPVAPVPVAPIPVAPVPVAPVPVAPTAPVPVPVPASAPTVRVEPPAGAPTPTVRIEPPAGAPTPTDRVEPPGAAPTPTVRVEPPGAAPTPTGRDEPPTGRVEPPAPPTVRIEPASPV